MTAVTDIGQSGRIAEYRLPDNALSTGSTLGAPKVLTVLKATGAIEKVFSVETGRVVFGTILLRHFDQPTGMYLAPRRGTFSFHAEVQRHQFSFANDVAVREEVFVLNSRPPIGTDVDPPAVYLAVTLTNHGRQQACIETYAFAELRGQTEHDVKVEYHQDLGALVAWNASSPGQARMFGCSEKPRSFETTTDYAKGACESSPGRLSGTTEAGAEPLGVLELQHVLEASESVSFYYLLTFSAAGREDAPRSWRACPTADEALEQTSRHYQRMLGRSVVLTPSPDINRGVLWAKANMLRIESLAPTGWCFTNDPTRSNNSVGRDTAWFAYGADYFTPEFVRESLLAYLRLQQPSGKIVEYYDIRTGHAEDYGLNINDNTPLLVLALWHHYGCTGDQDFLRAVYPAAAKAARYIVSQENDQGLVWCTSRETGARGIAGWRNVIQDYRLSGATTELNSECYTALCTVAEMASTLGQADDCQEFGQRAESLKEAINRDLLNPETGLYYLNLDIDGQPRSDLTSDLVFPIMFSVAPPDTEAAIIHRLSHSDFWTESGIRTTPRDAPRYSPDLGSGLLGGVWVGVTFWYAFAAAKYSPDFMERALSSSFRNYSTDPRRNNTVPGQFSEWLHGETLVNQGMMLSPWYPPRYLWAAIEGAAGVDLAHGSLRVVPRMASHWKWLAVRNLLYRGQSLTWFVVRTPEQQMYANCALESAVPCTAYEEDVTGDVDVTGDAVCALALRQGSKWLIFVGNTADDTIFTSLRLATHGQGRCRLRRYDSLLGKWLTDEDLAAERLRQGIVLQVERKGFCLLDICQTDE